MPAVSSLKQVVEGRVMLSRVEAAGLMRQIFAGELSELELAALLGGLGARGETAEELAGFIDALREAAVAIPLGDAERAQLVDTCGTGADSSGTFNISTAAALVAAAAGAKVAKHGNRAVTSACGSADVLEALGVPVLLSPGAAAAALRRHGFAFLHAPSLHPAMKAVMPVRRALGVRTVFNVLGPLANPAGARAQVMGVYAAHLVPVVADAMKLLGVRHAFVVHGAGDGGSSGAGMDEASISGETRVAEVRDGFCTFSQLTPERVGLTRAAMETLRGGDAAENAAILRGIFAGESGPRRDVVLLNAALVLITAGLVPRVAKDPYEEIRQGIGRAAEAIDSGAVSALVEALRSSAG